MRLLLDTHVFLWYITADTRLPASFQAAIQDPANEVFLSVVTVWEAVIKYELGKLPLPSPPADSTRQYPCPNRSGKGRHYQAGGADYLRRDRGRAAAGD